MDRFYVEDPPALPPLRADVSAVVTKGRRYEWVIRKERDGAYEAYPIGTVYYRANCAELMRQIHAPDLDLLRNRILRFHEELREEKALPNLLAKADHELHGLCSVAEMGYRDLVPPWARNR